jgi:hypothetical protein
LQVGCLEDEQLRGEVEEDKDVRDEGEVVEAVVQAVSYLMDGKLLSRWLLTSCW